MVNREVYVPEEDNEENTVLFPIFSVLGTTMSERLKDSIVYLTVSFQGEFSMLRTCLIPFFIKEHRFSHGNQHALLF